MRFLIALWLGKLVNFLARIIDSSKGSNLPGLKALSVDPKFIAHFKGIDYDKVLFITGTNGKSTTTGLIAHIAKQSGRSMVVNIEGSNLTAGVATALLKKSGLFGRVKADCFIFETDERYLQPIYEQLPCKNILITNLQKDQVQRNGDPDFIYRKVAGSFGKDVRLFLNNDEPRTKSFDALCGSIVTYGVKKHSLAFTKGDSYPTMACPKCAHRIEFSYFNTDGVGKFKCTSCGHSSSDAPDYQIDTVSFEDETFTYDGIEFKMPYAIPYMCYNYIAAIAVAKEFLGLRPEDIASCFSSFKNIGGRFEILKYKGKTIKYMRLKQENPETLQTCLNIAATDKSRKMVCLGLCPVSDFVPHNLNTFYAYDCDLSELIASDVEKYYCFSEGVCYDTANRLLYEGIDKNDIEIEETEEPEALFKAIEGVETDNIYLITWIKSYSSMMKYLKKESAGEELS